MKKRFLGKDFEVSAFGLGCMPMSAAYEEAGDINEMVKIIHKAMDLGITLFDTADIYGNYENEKLLGKALVGHREGINVSTKGGLKLVDGKQIVDGRPERIRQSCEASLKRLGIETIDIYYIHRMDPNVPIEELAGTMLELKAEGKIKRWGLSEPGFETLKKAHAIFPVSAVQSEYSMMWREPEQELMPLLEELGIGLVPFSPLCRGFLTGAIDPTKPFPPSDFRSLLPRFQPENMLKNQKLLDAVKQFASEKGVTCAQLAIAWILHQKDYIVPIPGTNKLSEIESNIKAAEVTFTDEEMKRINDTLDSIEISGDRYDMNSEYGKRLGK